MLDAYATLERFRVRFAAGVTVKSPDWALVQLQSADEDWASAYEITQRRARLRSAGICTSASGECIQPSESVLAVQRWYKETARRRESQAVVDVLDRGVDERARRAMVLAIKRQIQVKPRPTQDDVDMLIRRRKERAERDKLAAAYALII
jgi:hypothetical protein